MKIMVCEHMTGLAHYIIPLYNDITKNDNSKIIYLSGLNNRLKKSINPSITLKEVFKELKVDLKKGSLRWFTNRFDTYLRNSIIRNRYVKQERPNILNIQSIIPIIDQYFFRNLKKYTKIVLTVHNVIPHEKSKLWSRNSLKKIYDLSNHLIVHTNANKYELVKEFNIDSKKISVIHHGTDTSFDAINVTKAKAQFNLNQNKKNLLFFGQLREQKGLDILLEALKDIDCNLIIAGKIPNGENFNKYNNIIEDNNLSTNCFLEFISEEDLSRLFQVSDFVILPYKYFHSQSGVLMQAVKYRIPIIATDVSDFKAFIEDSKIGMVCEPNNVSDLNKTIIEAINDEKQYRIFKKNLDIVAKKNSWELSATQHLELFRSLVKVSLENEK